MPEQCGNRGPPYGLVREALFVSAFSANSAVNLNIGGHKMNTSCDIGMIGLGVMGRNLALNMADHGFAVAGYNRHLDKVALLEQEAEGRTVVGIKSEEELAKDAAKTPRGHDDGPRGQGRGSGDSRPSAVSGAWGPDN